MPKPRSAAGRSYVKGAGRTADLGNMFDRRGQCPDRLALALLLRWVTKVREPPALVLVAAGEIGRYLRRWLRWRAPRSAPELVQSEPAVAVPLGSLPTRLACAQAWAARIAGGTSKQAAGDASNPPAEYRKRQP